MMASLKVVVAFLFAMLPGAFLIFGAMYLYHRRKKKILTGAAEVIHKID